MAIIVPTVTAFDAEGYRSQIHAVSPFARRIHIDLMDGEFAPSVSPELGKTWWPPATQADIHLMYRRPGDVLQQLLVLRPHMVIIHAEADVDHMTFAAELHRAEIFAGLALLQGTTVESVERIIHSFDQVLIFSGKLGYHGGEADAEMLRKALEIRDTHPEVEVAWDGGINDTNAAALVEAGIDVLNVGGFIQGSADPATAYAKLKSVID